MSAAPGQAILSLAVPAIVLSVTAYGLYKGVDVFDALTAGAKEGLGVVARILPALIILLAVISMLRASGALDLAADALRPLCAVAGIPPECVPLMLIRPFSGSGALAVGAELIAAHGADSLIGRTAAVMIGSTETTFYVLGLYCGAAGVSKTRYALPCALLADATGFVTAALTVRLFG
ncbi:MAG: spore maturation protein [Oscillospiraceae bacterium]|nr:spore maturation protein [Oscillospiraceae bacterium]